MANATIADEFDAGSSTNDGDDVPVVQTIDNGVAFGFQCAKVVRDNQVTDIPLTFFLDVSFPIGSQDLALTYLQEEIVSSVALYYGVSNGQRCENPLLNGSTWLVQILSKTTDWKKETLFESCRELEFDKSTNECYVYQAVITGSVLDGSMNDVMTYIQNEFESGDLTENSPYSVLFLGAATADPSNPEGGRENLGGPSNVNEQESSLEAPSDRQTITIVGGLLVAAFCLAFIGVGFVLWRRRREWLNERELQLDQKNPGETNPSDDEEYGETQLRQDIYEDDHVEIDDNGLVKTVSSGDEFNNVTFDLVTTFKDQLMGVHGTKGPRPTGLYGRQLNSDGDSDADSWAQTDGTIGSLEPYLEPITAEV